MNSRLLVSQSPKGYCNDHKADASNGWRQNFPFCSKIDHVNTEEHKQDSSNGESRILFILNASDFLFSKEHLSSVKINCYENIFPPRFSWHYGIGSSVCISIEVKHYLRSKKGMFIHHVYFWLKNSGNKEDKAKLIEGLKKLSKVSTIKIFI